jgi:hypothetical protein
MRLAVTAIVAIMTALVGLPPAGLQAQSAPTASDVPKLSGVWTRGGRGGGGPRGDLPLNKRGIAFRDAIDEPMSGMYHCVPATTPHILGDPYNFKLDQQADRVIQTFEKDAVVRIFWLEGHGHHPAGPSDYALQGYSTARYENGALLVETSKFTFDPGGIADHAPMVPSSPLKKVVERYALEGGRLMVEATLEDPQFLTRPIRFAFEFQPAKDDLVEWPECDPEQASEPLKYIPASQLKYGLR